MPTSFRFLILSSALALAACASESHLVNAAAVPIRVLTANGDNSHQVVDAGQQASLQALWKNKRNVMVKQRPDFQYRVEFGKDASAQWLYSSSGYTVLASEPYGQIYLIADHDHANRLLGVQPSMP